MNNNFIHPLLEIKYTDKGVGIFAKDDIPINTVIIKEIPIIYNSSNIYKYLNLPLFKQLSKLLLVLLNSDNKEQFLKLVPHIEDKYIIKYNRIEEYHKKYFKDIDKETICLYFSKIMRNAFYFNNHIPSILFYGTQINHSCDPNVNYKPKGKYMIFTTIMNISKDNELYGLYINSETAKTMNRQMRQQYLLNHYAFECKCNKCSL